MSNNQYTIKRPPTSGVPVGMRPPSRTARGNDRPISSSKKIAIVDRPLSINGLPSVNIQSGKRYVADKTYFIGILRYKINEIVKEIELISTKIDEKKHNQSIQKDLAQSVATLKDEISKSEAELTDYNVLTDHIQNGIYIDDIISEYQELEQSNSLCEEEVNKNYKEKRDLEKLVLEQEKNVINLMNGEYDPQLHSLAKEIEILESKCKEIKNRSIDVNGKSREELLQMVKNITKKIGDTDKMIIDEKKTISYINQQIKIIEEKEEDLQSDRGKKYLKLLQKEKDMNTFIQNFHKNLEHTKEEISNSQKNIINTLISTSHEIESTNNLPSNQEIQLAYKQIKTDLAYKEKQVINDQETIHVLQIEVEKQRAVLEHLNEVDSKIQDEIEKVTKNIKDMEAEMPNFQDIDTKRQENKIDMLNKTAERDQLKNQLQHLKKITNELVSNYNKVNHQVMEDDINNKLRELEANIRQKASENNSIKEVIDENRRITNYAIVKKSVMNIVDEINSFL